jgi:ParB/RepB/Spo0J family partition protein
MATTTDVPPGVQMIALEEIRTDRNVRQQLVAEEVDALAQSIKLLGQLTPVSVRPAEDGGYVLIAGHKRCAALTSLGETQVRAEIRAESQEEAERAAENIVRSDLNPYEEAVAVRAMLDRGLTVDGAAQALGWNRARVTARVKLLELPELAQQMVGDGRLPLSSVEQLRAIGAVSPSLLDALIDYLADGNEWAAERLTREPGWVLDSALRSSNTKVFAAHLGGRVDKNEIAALRLGKKAEAAYERAGELTQVLDRYAYYVDVRFDESDVDQARAAGVVIEFERSAPIIVDRSLYRELVKAAITRTVAELEAKVAAREQERKAVRQSQKTGGAPADPAAEVEREHRSRMRQLSDQAHGVNLDVGARLLNALSTVDPADVNVAKFFVYGLLGADYDDSPYTQQGERIARLAVAGIRLVIEQFRADVTKTRKDGSKGALRIDYGNGREPEEPLRWLWKYIDGAKSAGELYGRALVVIAAEQYASRLVVPQSQRTHPTRWSSHKDLAAKALAKLTTPHLPASLRQLEVAVKRAHEEHDSASERARAAARHASRTNTADETSPPAAQDQATDVEVDVEDDDEAEQ